jgi:hypothetical protein
MADSDDEDYIFVGTPLEEQVEGKAGLRPKPVKDASQTEESTMHAKSLKDASQTGGPGRYAQAEKSL